MDGTLSRRLGAAMMAVLITAAAAGCAGGARNRTNVTTPGGTTAPNVGANLVPGVTGAGMAGAGGGGAAAGGAAGYGGGLGNRVIRSYGEMDLGRQISRYVASLDVISGGGMTGAGAAGAGAAGAGATGAGTTGAGMTGAGMTGAGATNAPGGYTAGGGGGMAVAGPTGAGAADAANAGAGPGIPGTLTPGAGTTGAAGGGAAPGAGPTGAGTAGAGTTGAGGGGTSVVTLPRQVGVSTLVVGDMAFIGVTLPAQAGARLGAATGVSPAGDHRGSGGPGLEGYLRQTVLTEFPQLSQVFVTTNPGMVSRIARVTGDGNNARAAHQVVSEMLDIARTMAGPPTVRPTGARR